MINLMRQGRDDPDMVAIAEACQEEAIEIFKSAAEQEKAWANYLFKDGSMIGLNRDILCQYIEFITNTVCRLLDCQLFLKPNQSHSLD